MSNGIPSEDIMNAWIVILAVKTVAMILTRIARLASTLRLLSKKNSSALL